VQAEQHDLALARVADVEARILSDQHDLADALRVLDRAEAAAGAPLVDQSERHRLERALSEGSDPGEHHHAVLAHRDGDCVGYAGIVVPEGVQHGVGDVAFQHGATHCRDVLQALLVGVDALVRDHEAHGTQLWIRQAGPDDVLVAVAAGYAVDRRLAVLGRSLEGFVDAPSDDIRTADPDDVDAIVDVLAAAYASTADGGWDRDRFEEHAEQDWFRFEDVLVAPGSDGTLHGVHWTKRRGRGVGEVYNLAVAPAGQGQGLGRRLLDAGLDHLHGVGCDDVLLWVDLANEAAIRLYTTAGFTARWEDIAFIRHARGVGRHDHVGRTQQRPDR
jgi:mycothiol synthase